MKYYLHDLAHATVNEIKLNNFINTIALYIKINFLMFGIYKAVKTSKKEYQIISLFDNEIVYIINTNAEV